MNRVEIKELAKSKISGNKWNILWPIIVISIVEYLIQVIFKISPYNLIDFTDLESLTKFEMPAYASFGIALISVIFGIVMIAYKRYILNFVRTGKFEIRDIFDCVKEKWSNIFLAELLVSLIVGLCSLLIVIPGIIMAMAYGMVTYLVIDSNLSAVDSLKTSRNMMRGYKLNYFVFYLSFIGWFILVPFTCGFLLIWLLPYVTVADAIYYEKLKEITKK